MIIILKNACICVETDFTPRKVLTILLAIEKTLGRIRTKTKGYESRVIDLDIIFFEDKITDTKVLKLPHPEMHKRKFVLLPLNDIASDFVHPKKKKEVVVLLENRKYHADSFLQELENVLIQDYGAGKVVYAKKFSYSAPCAEETLDSLSAECDVVVHAIAD